MAFGSSRNPRAACIGFVALACIVGCQGGQEGDLGTAASNGHDPATPGAADAEAAETPIEEEARMRLQQEPFGETADGRPVTQFHLSNANEVAVSLIDYGAIVTAVYVPDRNGESQNVTLGFDNIEGYLARHPYFGAICGRYANRIAGGTFELDSETYIVTKNDGENHLHGGEAGFDKAMWLAEPFENEASAGVRLTHESPDNDQGYPGKLTATVTYTLTDENELRIDYEATCDKATPINLTNHCYWNLAGAGSSTILDHLLTIGCDQYLPVNETMIPTGEQASVTGTPMDFTQPERIGARIDEVAGGYDHCYVFSAGQAEPALIARAEDPDSGRVLEIFTTEPGVQLYTGNFLDGSEAAGGFEKHEGFCLECQHFPDSPNQPEFPNTILQPREVYRQTTIHKFSVNE